MKKPQQVYASIKILLTVAFCSPRRFGISPKCCHSQSSFSIAATTPSAMPCDLKMKERNNSGRGVMEEGRNLWVLTLDIAPLASG